MDKFRFLILVCLLTFAVSCGQQKRFVTYKVKSGETMKSIAKRLDMKTRDLMRLNPDVSRKPAENTMIIIPEAKKSTSSKSAETESKKDEGIEVLPPANDGTVKVENTVVSFQTHTVQPKETVYALTKKHEISKETLVEWNPQYPDLKDNKLDVGQVLNVKKIEKKSYEYITKSEELEQYVTHTVQPKETLFSLTQKYGVTKDELVALNPNYPNLSNDQLGVGEVLKIRLLSEEDQSWKENTQAYFDNIQYGNSVNLAILLPINGTKYKETEPDDIFKKSKLTSIITDFYLGAEIAIDSLKKQGVSVQAKFFDTGKKGSKTSKVLLTNELDNVDLVIGPFYSNQAKAVANKVKVPVIFPHFSNKQKGFLEELLVKASPDATTYAKKLGSFLRSKYNGEAIFVVGDGKPVSNTYVNEIVADLKKHNDIKDINVLKPEKGYIRKTRFTGKMKSGAHCWVIMTSDDTASVADALNSFVVLPNNVTARFFAVTKNKAYDKVDNSKLARLNFTYVTDSYINEKKSSTKSFNKKYKAKNKSLPTEYAIKGFDITYDAIARMASGKKLTDTFEEGTSSRVANKFSYKKNSSASTNNNGLFIVKYNKDLSLSELKE